MLHDRERARTGLGNGKENFDRDECYSRIMFYVTGVLFRHAQRDWQLVNTHDYVCSFGRKVSNGNKAHWKLVWLFLSRNKLKLVKLEV